MADVGRTEVKVGAEALRKGSRNGDEDDEITADTMKRPRAAEGWLMKRWMPTTRVMVWLLVLVVVLARMFGGKRFQVSGRCAVRMVWRDLGLIKEGVGPVLISAWSSGTE